MGASGICHPAILAGQSVQVSSASTRTRDRATSPPSVTAMLSAPLTSRSSSSRSVTASSAAADEPGRPAAENSASRRASAAASSSGRNSQGSRAGRSSSSTRSAGPGARAGGRRPASGCRSTWPSSRRLRTVPDVHALARTAPRPTPPPPSPPASAWCGKRRSSPPTRQVDPGPSVACAIAAHSACQPGRPQPHGLGHAGSPSPDGRQTGTSSGSSRAGPRGCRRTRADSCTRGVVQTRGPATRRRGRTRSPRDVGAVRSAARPPGACTCGDVVCAPRLVRRAGGRRAPPCPARSANSWLSANSS